MQLHQADVTFSFPLGWRHMAWFVRSIFGAMSQGWSANTKQRSSVVTSADKRQVHTFHLVTLVAHVKCYYETKLVMLMLIYWLGSGNTCASLVTSLKRGYDSAVGRNMDLLLVSGYWHLSRCGIKRDAGLIHVSHTEFPDKRRMFCAEAGGTCFLQDGCNQPDYSLSDAWNWYDCMAMGVAV